MYAFDPTERLRRFGLTSGPGRDPAPGHVVDSAPISERAREASVAPVPGYKAGHRGIS
jgi:hypothetical protein